MALLLTIVFLAGKAVAAPNIGLPINSQVPPVARVSKPFSFTFSESTFASSTGVLDYVVTETPAWLQFDAPNRTLYGTPGLDDTGSPNFNLVAKDITGSTTMPVTLIVSTSAGPGLGTPVEEQLAAHDSFQAPDTVLVPRSSALSLSFTPDTFVNTNHDTVYYAMCANNTPLPSWITFDTGSLSFSGTAPQNTSPDELPQTFGIQFTASDVAGFSAAVASFRVTVENHVLMFGEEYYAVNITQGLPFIYKGLQGTLRLNGNPIDHAPVREIHLDIPTWMSFDQDTWVLSGIPPPSATSQNISVTAKDIYGEVAVTTILLQVETNATADLFIGTLGNINATAGIDFTYTFNQSIVTTPDAELAVDLGPASSWLRFDDVKLELSGHVPRDLQPQDIVLNVTLSQGPTIRSEPLTISVQDPTHSTNGRSADTPSPSASSSTAVSSTITAPSTSQETQSRSPGNNSRVAAAIAVPVITVCLLLILACFVLARRKRRRTETDWSSEQKRKVSRPFVLDETRDKRRTGAFTEKPARALERPSRAPLFDLHGLRTSMASKRHSFFRLSKGTTDEAVQTPNVDPWLQYVQGLSEPEGPTQKQFSLVPEERAPSARGRPRTLSSKQPFRISNPLGITNVSSSKRTGQNKRKSDMSFATSGLPTTQRMSGFGHGRNGSSLGTSSLFGWGPVGVGHGNGGPPNWGRVRTSWRDPSRSSWSHTDSTIKSADHASINNNSSERSQDIGSTMRSFPRPPTSGTLDYLSQPPITHETAYGRQKSIRAVEPEPPLTYSLSLHAFNKRRARNRQYRNTFFAAGPSSRASSNLDWTHQMHSAMLSPTQSMDSTTSMMAKRRSSRLGHSATQRTYSRSSSLEPPIPSPSRPNPRKPKPSPHKRTSDASNNNNGRGGLATLISNAITQRFHSSKSSIASSHRFGSAASGDLSPSPSPDFGLEEHQDEQGNRRWRHRDLFPNPLALHTPGGSPQTRSLDTGDEEGFAPAAREMVERWGRTTEGVGGRFQRMSFLRGQQGAAAGGGGPRRVLVGGSRGKRPVSVDNGLVARGKSMRGDLVRGDGEVDDVAFL
ncbi:MAG: hypothetical protein Q9172_002461 [Xanthocarpia lactea]